MNTAIEFRYTNRGPNHSQGVGHVRTNVIRLSRDNEGAITFSRHYVRKDGSFDEEGISQTLPRDSSPREIARRIHWGCCGWDANSVELHSLIEQVEKVFVFDDERSDVI